jgi:hypothetical protein
LLGAKVVAMHPSVMGNLGPSQHLRHPGPADAQVSSERGPALEIARVQQRRIISGELERIAAFLRCRFWFGFGVGNGIPGE